MITAAALAIAAVLVWWITRRRVRRQETRRGVIESAVEVGLPAPVSGTLTSRHNGYMRYRVRLANGEAAEANSYLPRETGDAVDLVFDGKRYAFRFDRFLPALILAGAAVIAGIVAAMMP